MNQEFGLRWSDRSVVTVLAIAAIFVLAVSYSVFSATTVDTNLKTAGDVYASSTVQATGVGRFYSDLFVSSNIYATSTVVSTGNGVFVASLTAGSASTVPSTTFSVSGSAYITTGLGVGFATTGAGQIHTTGLIVGEGRLGVSGTTSPYQELGVVGDLAAMSAATTTVSVESSSTSGCIELRDAARNRWVRLYPTSTSSSLSYIIIELGRCQ